MGISHTNLDVPLPKSVEEGGVKMLCTSTKCEFSEQLVHPECFELLELKLTKVIGSIGMHIYHLRPAK